MSHILNDPLCPATQVMGNAQPIKGGEKNRSFIPFAKGGEAIGRFEGILLYTLPTNCCEEPRKTPATPGPSQMTC
jgi:hypothetical protein